MKRTKLLYILPEYDANAPTHHVHIFELLEELGKKLDIFLLVEKSVGKPVIANLKQVYAQKINFPLFAHLERLAVILWCRLNGYKKAYVHYSYWGAILASLVFRPTGGKVFYWHCEVYDRFFSRFNWTLESVKRKALDEYLMVLTLKLITFLVTGTKSVGGYYRRQFSLSADKVRIIPNWVNLKRFHPVADKKSLRRQLTLPVSKKIVTFAHRLAPRKGADLLPQIISAVTRRVSGSWFLVAGGGGGPLKEDLVKVFKKRKLEEDMQLVNGIPNLELPGFLAASDLFIMPSRQEGFPRILIECMACGLPFVAMDVGGTRDIVSQGQKRGLIATNDVEAFITTIVSLLKNPNELRRLSRQGQLQVRKYGLDVVSKKFLKLFTE